MKGKFLVVVYGGPNHLIGKTAYWECDKTTFGRQELYDLFGNFHRLNEISREHLRLHAVNRNGRIYFEPSDNNSTHGCKIELHPYNQYVPYGGVLSDNWLVSFGDIIKISIGEGFKYYVNGPGNGSGYHKRCEKCNIPTDVTNICELCVKTKPITSHLISESEPTGGYWPGRSYDALENLDVKLTPVSRKGDFTTHHFAVPGLSLHRNGQYFDLTITEVEKLFSLIQNEFSLHHRMCSEYCDSI